jgi:SAM-dependent methyltransferase
MHETSLAGGKAFAESYGFQNALVVDFGGRNVNGSLRSFFEERGMKYICVDMEADSSVDIVAPPGEKLPFEDGSVDFIVSTSCFEHDPCFWLTFREMTRIIKPTGYIYVNAPTSGPYHCYPGDNWRFYSDAGQALAYWSGKQVANEPIYPVKVIETFNILGTVWNDFVCVWKRVGMEEKEETILVKPEILHRVGILEQTINRYGYGTRKKC